MEGIASLKRLVYVEIVTNEDKMIRYLVSFGRGLLIIGWVILALGILMCLIASPIIVINSPNIEYKWVFYLLTGVDVIIGVYLIYRLGDSWIDR